MICKHYVNGNCNKENCKYQHIDNICVNYFFNTCNKINCKFKHDFKFKNNNKKIIKTTETFQPNHSEPTMKIIFNKIINSSNQICIIKNIDWGIDIYNKLLNEISNDLYIPWHGDTHLIANDKANIDWKKDCTHFNNIIKKVTELFKMSVSATRFNYYESSFDWKPYHHDAAAVKPDIAKVQNITVGISFGLERDISFETTEDNKSIRKTINFPLEHGTLYAFGNKINSDFRHGIPQLKDEINEGRISIIIWGYSLLI